MEPLSKEEIEALYEQFYMEHGCFVTYEYKRLFFTARLGAAYEQATKSQKEKQS